MERARLSMSPLHRIAAYAFAALPSPRWPVILLVLAESPRFRPGQPAIGPVIDILIIAVVGGLAAPRSVPFIGAFDLCPPAHLCARFPGLASGSGGRTLPAFDRPWVPGDRLLVSRRASGTLGPIAVAHGFAHRTSRLDRTQRGGAVAMNARRHARTLPRRRDSQRPGIARCFQPYFRRAGGARGYRRITVRPGERRGVLGSNGAGKTTLFNCITGDFLPTSGVRSVMFGEDVTRFPPHERIRRGLRRTYQISLLFGGAERNRQYLSRLPRRVAGTILHCCGRRRERRADAVGRRVSPHAVHLDERCNTLGRGTCPMASSGSSKSPWRWPARRASFCSTSRQQACLRRNGAT